MHFYLTFGFLAFKAVNKRTMNLSKGSEDFGFLNLVRFMLCKVMWNLFTAGSLQFCNDSTTASLEANKNRPKYKPALSKSDSSWDNSCCVRLVIVSLALNIDELQPLVSEDNFFC